MLQAVQLFPEVDTYVVHVSSFPNSFQQNTSKIHKFVAMAKEKGITVAFESNPIFPLLQWYPKETYEPLTFADFCIKNKLAITFDTAHIASAGGNIIDFYRKYYEYITVIHLSDFKDGIEHLPLGQGVLSIDELLQEIRKSRKHHKVIFEMNTFPRAKNKKDKIHDIKRSVEFVKKYLT